MARLVKSRNRWVDGVAGGVANYFNINPDLLRIILLVAVLVLQMHFLIPVYLILMMMMPGGSHVVRREQNVGTVEVETDGASEQEPHAAAAEQTENLARDKKMAANSGRMMQVFGLLLIFIGAVYLIQNQFPGLWADLEYFWVDVRFVLEEMRTAILGIALILGGLWLIYKNKKSNKRFQ